MSRWQRLAFRAKQFDPRTLGNMSLWLDAADASTITLNGSGVSQWNDKSGNGRNATQSTAAIQPTYTTNNLNGRPTLRAVGDKNMVVSGWTYANTNTSVFVFRGSALNQGIAQRGTLNDGPRSALQGSPTVTLRTTIHGSSATQITAEAPYTLNQWAIGASIITSSTIATYSNGTFSAAASYSPGLSGNLGLVLFALNTSNLYAINGGIAEFMAWDRSLSEAEVTRVARYLSKKWGIAIS